MNKPEGPSPPKGYRWVEKGETIWPTDVTVGIITSSLIRADVVGASWKKSDNPHKWARLKVTQPDLTWLKSKALEQAKLHPEGSIERERILWAVTEDVRAYSDSLRALVPEREQWRPKQEGGKA